VISTVQDDAKCSRDLLVGHRGYAVLFVSRHANLIVNNAVLFDELGIWLGVWFRNQGP
jgi:hypothetical protein